MPRNSKVTCSKYCPSEASSSPVWGAPVRRLQVNPSTGSFYGPYRPSLGDVMNCDPSLARNAPCFGPAQGCWDRMNVMMAQTGDANGGWCPPFFSHVEAPIYSERRAGPTARLAVSAARVHLGFGLPCRPRPPWSAACCDRPCSARCGAIRRRS